MFNCYEYFWTGNGLCVGIILLLYEWRVRCWLYHSSDLGCVSRSDSVWINKWIGKSCNWTAECKFYFSLPLDQRTPLGYFGEVCLFTSGILTCLLANGALLLLFVSVCWHHQAFYEMFRHSVRKLNVPNEYQNDAELLCQLIRFHILVKRWVESMRWYSS